MYILAANVDSVNSPKISRIESIGYHKNFLSLLNILNIINILSTFYKNTECHVRFNVLRNNFNIIES